MTCENCKIKKATYFYTGNDKSKHALCSVCAAEKNITEGIESGMSLENVSLTAHSSLTEASPGKALMPCIDKSSDGILCPVCKTSLSEIIKSGCFGCPECLNAFEKNEIFAGIIKPCKGILSQDSDIRMPSKQKIKYERRRIISELKIRIKDAISNEDFESAAILRDKIKMLEKDA